MSYKEIVKNRVSMMNHYRNIGMDDQINIQKMKMVEEINEEKEYRRRLIQERRIESNRNKVENLPYKSEDIVFFNHLPYGKKAVLRTQITSAMIEKEISYAIDMRWF